MPSWRFFHNERLEKLIEIREKLIEIRMLDDEYQLKKFLATLQIQIVSLKIGTSLQIFDGTSGNLESLRVVK